MKKTKKTISPFKRNLFFGFYFFFFLAIFLAYNYIDKKNTEERDKIYTIYKTDMIENNICHYNYIINDQEKIIEYKGYTNDKEHDYSKDEHYYLLDFYNVKQLIKNSKITLYNLIDDNHGYYTLELNNQEIYKYYEGNNQDLINNIELYINSDYEVYEIKLDLSNYFGYQYNIDMKYEVIYE